MIASAAGEMPPKKKARPDSAAAEAFIKSLASSLTEAEMAKSAKEGRATQRRLNRYEYESALRDLLHAPWLAGARLMPEDGEADRFNKIGDALDVSHVQMARYLGAADYALRQAMATQAEAAPAEGSALLRARPAQLHGPDEVLRIQHGARARNLPGARLRGTGGRAPRGCAHHKHERGVCGSWRASAWWRALTRAD